jgi:Ycf66 protein N-terminus
LNLPPKSQRSAKDLLGFGGIVVISYIILNYLQMLAYFLSVLVGTGSVGLYFAAFLFPEIYRKQDFIWSGLGLFYALVLWVEAGQLSGGLLVGQTASVVLLLWFGWQNIGLRRQLSTINPASPLLVNKSSSSLPVVDSLPKEAESLGEALSSEPAQPWIEIRQEFPAAEPSIDPGRYPEAAD